MIRPCRTQLAGRTRHHAVTGRGAGTRWPARRGDRRGRSGRRRTGSSAGRPRGPGAARFTKARAVPAGIRTRKISSGSGSSKSSSTCSGETTAASLEREHLDHDPLVVGVPRQRHRAGAELLLDRLLERVGVLQAQRRHGGDHRLVELAGHHLVEQLVDPLGQRRDLLLLQRDADDACAGARLEEERALTRAGRRCPRRSAPAGRIRGRGVPWVHPRGGPKPGPRGGRGPPRRRPRRPRAAGRDARTASSLGGASHARSPSWVLVAST